MEGLVDLQPVEIDEQRGGGPIVASEIAAVAMERRADLVSERAPVRERGRPGQGHPGPRRVEVAVRLVDRQVLVQAEGPTDGSVSRGDLDAVRLEPEDGPEADAVHPCGGALGFLARRVEPEEELLCMVATHAASIVGEDQDLAVPVPAGGDVDPLRPRVPAVLRELPQEEPGVVPVALHALAGEAFELCAAHVIRPP